MNDSCPCGSGSTYASCCQPYHTNVNTPQTAEALMRSRYSAYALCKVDYIINTSSPKLRAQINPEELANYSNENEWLGLKIISKTLGGFKHDTGEVEFQAFYKDKSGNEFVQHELSTFTKEDNRWYYSSGKVNPKSDSEVNKTHRNDPCPCGSGKKFKRCCY